MLSVNRLLYALAPGLGQILNGRYGVGMLMGAAAVGTVVLGEAMAVEYRRLGAEYRKLNVPASMTAALLADRRKAFGALVTTYGVLGLASAALYRDEPAEEAGPEEPEETA